MRVTSDKVPFISFDSGREAMGGREDSVRLGETDAMELMNTELRSTLLSSI